MGVQEEIENLRERYQTRIKPLIDNEEYMIASFELGNFIMLLSERGEELTQVHMGMSFFASARLLEERLREGNKENIENVVRMFEAYSAQTTLPLKRQ